MYLYITNTRQVSEQLIIQFYFNNNIISYKYNTILNFYRYVRVSRTARYIAGIYIYIILLYLKQRDETPSKSQLIARFYYPCVLQHNYGNEQ
jgi:hypothetical protein